jgi:hypothetical protein
MDPLRISDHQISHKAFRINLHPAAADWILECIVVEAPSNPKYGTRSKQARNRSPSQMCGTPAVSIPVWLGTGSAQVGTDGIGRRTWPTKRRPERHVLAPPAFVGRRFCFPHRRPKEAREGTAQRPPSRERGRPTSWPSHPPLVLPLDDDESTEKIH